MGNWEMEEGGISEVPWGLGLGGPRCKSAGRMQHGDCIENIIEARTRKRNYPRRLTQSFGDKKLEYRPQDRCGGHSNLYTIQNEL